MSRIPTSTSAVTTTGLLMPGDFPVAAYQAIHIKIAPHASTNKPLYDQFAGAWNAISYRYSAFADYDDLFSVSISKYGAGPPAEERYYQERDLFGFFNSGFSTFEAFFYATFALGAFLQPTRFPISTPQDQRRITAASTIAAYRAGFPNHAIVGGGHHNKSHIFGDEGNSKRPISPRPSLPDSDGSNASLSAILRRKFLE